MSPTKRRLIIILATLLLVAMAPAVVMAAGGQFTDDDDSIFEAHIEWLASAGVTAGCNPPANDNFCPNDNVNRGQMAAFMRRFAQYIGAEDGTPALADHATTAGTADSAAAADLASDSRALGGKGAIAFQPSTNDFEAGDLTVSSNGTHSVVSATVTTTDGSGFFCLVGTSHTADILVHASAAVTGLSAGDSASFYLADSSGEIQGTTRYVYDGVGSFAISFLYEDANGGTETFELVAYEFSGDTYTIVDAVIVAEVISDTRCKGTPVIVLPNEPTVGGPDDVN